jgi:hypothetical protein
MYILLAGQTAGGWSFCGVFRPAMMRIATGFMAYCTSEQTKKTTTTEDEQMRMRMMG